MKVALSIWVNDTDGEDDNVFDISTSLPFNEMGGI